MCYSKIVNYTTEQMREYQNARRAALRAELISLLDGKCVRCGITENLQFDHIDPKTKLFPIASGLDKPRVVLLAEVAKCQLLCEPHHIEKNIEDGSIARGEQKWNAKLTEKDIHDIRISKLDYRELMKIYNLSKTQVMAVRSGRAWKHIPMPGCPSGQRDLTVNQAQLLPRFEP